MTGASGQDTGHQHGSDIRNEVGGLIEGIVVDVLSRAEVAESVRSGAQFYERFSLARAGFELGFFIGTQNYAGAAFVVARHVAGNRIASAAANVILEKGGFAARLQLDPERREVHGRLLAGTLRPHSSVSIWRIYDEEPYWGAERAHTMGELAFSSVDLSHAASRNAVMIEGRVDGRPYERFGWFQRDAIYRGTWVEDEREGWGTLSFPGFGAYSGSWSAGAPNGFGEIRYEDGRSYTGSINPGSGDRVIGVSVFGDGTIYAGEHRFPLYVFPDGTEAENTRILPDGYGVRINDSRAFRATWRAGEMETELPTEAEHMAEVLQDIVERNEGPTDTGVRSAQWRLKQVMHDSVWNQLEQRLADSATVFLYDRSI